MKGIVFNLLEEVVRRHHGEEAWDALIDKAAVTGAYTSLGNYPDRELLALVEAACDHLEMPRQDVLKWFGREAMSDLSRKYPAFFTAYDTARSFVLSVNDFIHPEVRKLYSGADCPFFKFEHADSGALIMTYRSARKLCQLAEGFVEGVALHYKEQVRFTHIKCQHRGDDHCRFEIAWPEKAPISCTEA